MSNCTPKYIVALECFLERQEQGLTTLEAMNLYGDTCLHTTVSDLCNNRGLGFRRVPEEHCHRGGGKTKLMRYWLLPQSVEQATAVIESYKNKKAPAKTEAKNTSQTPANDNQPEVA